MLEPVIANLAASSLRSTAIVNVAVDLNIARRNWKAYPQGHPLVEAAISRLLESLGKLIEISPGIQIGLTKEGLLSDGEFIEKSNPNCRSVSLSFFERGIGAVTIQRLPVRDELVALLGILAHKRETVFAEGGILKLWNESGITSIQIKVIRYDRFGFTEEKTLPENNSERKNSIWEEFVSMMMNDEVSLSGVDADDKTDPGVLAAILNSYFAKHFDFSGVLPEKIVSSAIAAMNLTLEISDSRDGQGTSAENSCVKTDDSSGDAAKQTDGIVSEDKELVKFITALDPVLRRQILNGFCEADSAHSLMAEKLFNSLDPGLLLSTYADANDYASAPQMLQHILKNLLPHLVSAYETSGTDEEICKKMQTILQEHIRELYMPDDYIQGIMDLIDSNQLPHLTKKETDQILETVQPQFIDSRSSELIIQMVIADPSGKHAEELIQNLAELCEYFLKLGDYGQVLKLLNQVASRNLPQALKTTMREAFCKREFLDEILSRLSIWGKPKYDQVTQLIQILGRVFIEPLLDRMAEEENMSLRRFMMDRVQSFGTAARPFLINRLKDKRWYVVRNILLMLRSIETSKEDIEFIRPVMKHHNEKVRLEALKSLLLMGDPVAHRQLMRDLDSNDRETQLNAINMAGRNSPPELVRKLALIVTSGGYSAVEFELKAAAVQTLGEIGRPEILPELSKVLSARSLLAFKMLSRLKIEIIKSLERYPGDTVIPLLEKLATGNDEVARQASASLTTVKNRSK